SRHPVPRPKTPTAASPTAGGWRGISTRRSSAGRSTNWPSRATRSCKAAAPIKCRRLPGPAAVVGLATREDTAAWDLLLARLLQLAILRVNGDGQAGAGGVEQRAGTTAGGRRRAADQVLYPVPHDQERGVILLRQPGQGPHGSARGMVAVGVDLVVDEGDQWVNRHEHGPSGSCSRIQRSQSATWSTSSGSRISWTSSPSTRRVSPVA